MSDWSDKFYYERANVHINYVDDSKGLVLQGNRFTLVSVGKNLGIAFEYACRIEDTTLLNIIHERLSAKKELVDHWIRDHWPKDECEVCADRESGEAEDDDDV